MFLSLEIWMILAFLVTYLDVLSLFDCVSPQQRFQNRINGFANIFYQHLVAYITKNACKCCK